MHSRDDTRSTPGRFSVVTALGLAVILLNGCAAPRPFPPADLSAPGWTIQSGQAVWDNGKSDLAGELVFAKRSDGSAALQFIKTPLPLVSAQTRGSQWTITFIADNRTVSGKGRPPTQLLWLHLVSALQGELLRPPLHFSRDAEGHWKLENPKTRETISGFLYP